MLQIKAIPVETQVDTEKREVVAYASTFGNRDRVGDIVHPGAFKATLALGPFAQGRVAYKYNHTSLIGRPIHAEEDSKGLLTVAKVSKTPLGDEKLTLMADKSLSTYSFKYETVKGKVDVGQDGARNLRELKLYEFGPVDPDLAVNPEASVLSVKGDHTGFYGVCDYICALQDYVEGLAARDKLTTEERAMLDKAYADIQALAPNMKSLLESGNTTPQESGVATQSKESLDKLSLSGLALALSAAARERMTLVRQ